MVMKDLRRNPLFTKVAMNTKLAWEVESHEIISRPLDPMGEEKESISKARMPIQTFFAKDPETIRKELARAKMKANKHPSFFEMIGSLDDALI